MNIPTIIKAKRKSLGETQTEFGSRFGGIRASSVSNWEKGVFKAPYRVISFAFNNNECPHCGKTIILQTNNT